MKEHNSTTTAYNIRDLGKQRDVGSIEQTDNSLQLRWTTGESKYRELFRAVIEEVNRKGNFQARLTVDGKQIEEGSANFFAALRQEVFSSLNISISEETI